MILVARLKRSLLPAAIHFFWGIDCGVRHRHGVVFVWYPWPYDEFSGGRSLFLMLIGVDVVCGPLLTLLLVTETKPRRLLVLRYLIGTVDSRICNGLWPVCGMAGQTNIYGCRNRSVQNHHKWRVETF
ncbi:MAG: hypothetical protein R3E55_15010 [Burkholderiaceae bacterium]